MRSKEICEEEGGHLVKISSGKENLRIMELMNEMKLVGKRFGFYIGLQYQKKADSLVWSSDQTKVGYENFANGNKLKNWFT